MYIYVCVYLFVYMYGIPNLSVYIFSVQFRCTLCLWLSGCLTVCHDVLKNKQKKTHTELKAFMFLALLPGNSNKSC